MWSGTTAPRSLRTIAADRGADAGLISDSSLFWACSCTTWGFASPIFGGPFDFTPNYLDSGRPFGATSGHLVEGSG